MPILWTGDELMPDLTDHPMDSVLAACKDNKAVSVLNGQKNLVLLIAGTDPEWYARCHACGSWSCEYLAFEDAMQHTCDVCWEKDSARRHAHNLLARVRDAASS